MTIVTSDSTDVLMFFREHYELNPLELLNFLSLTYLLSNALFLSFYDIFPFRATVFC